MQRGVPGGMGGSGLHMQVKGSWLRHTKKLRQLPSDIAVWVRFTSESLICGGTFGLAEHRKVLLASGKKGTQKPYGSRSVIYGLVVRSGCMLHMEIACGRV